MIILKLHRRVSRSDHLWPDFSTKANYQMNKLILNGNLFVIDSIAYIKRYLSSRSEVIFTIPKVNNYSR